MRSDYKRRAVAGVVAGVLALTMAACGDDDDTPSSDAGGPSADTSTGDTSTDDTSTDDTSTGDTAGGDEGAADDVDPNVEVCKQLVEEAESAPESGADTFVFAASSDPVSLNPFYASDGETFRISRQIFEGLVTAEPCTPDPAPLLATDWETSPDGKSTTFTLREGVTFHDGTPFDAQAVCDNFEFWDNQPKGPAQSEDTTYYWISLFKRDADPAKPSIYDSCEPNGDYEVTINLTQPFAGFVGALTLPAFAMQSPTALEKYNANGGGEDPLATEYSTAHPTGTGPYVFQEWNRGSDVRLTANEDYWGDVPKTPNVVVRTISEPSARRDALLAGEIDGYDLVSPGDLTGLEEQGMQLVNRPAFTILYLGMNQARKPLDDSKVRQAIAHAIDKDALVASLPPGTLVAKEFIPPSVIGYADDVTEYEYDPEKAKELLAEAGAEDLTLEFNYPTDVSRPYMPDPTDTYNRISAMLEEVGITIKPVSDQWTPNYLNKVQGSPNHGIHLLGWTGDYNSTDNFLGTFFGRKSSEWGFDNPELFKALSDAKGLPTTEEQEPAYEQINRDIMEYLPGVPLAHPVPTLAFSPNVVGYIPSPVQDEVWNKVVVAE